MLNPSFIDVYDITIGKFWPPWAQFETSLLGENVKKSLAKIAQNVVAISFGYLIISKKKNHNELPKVAQFAENLFLCLQFTNFRSKLESLSYKGGKACQGQTL